jgi:hypothetical protein
VRVVLSSLLAANLLVLAWSQGWLSPLLEPPSAREREPQREGLQIRPEAIRVVAAPREAASGSSPAAAAAGATVAPGLREPRGVP